MKTHSYERTIGVDYTSSIRLEIPENQKLKREEVVERLSQHAVLLANPEVPIIGAIIGSGEKQTRREVVLGLDPSRKWGTPSIEENESLADYIATQEGWRRRDEKMPAMRVPLGRRREYGADNEVVSMDRVESLLRAQGRQALRLTESDLFSIRFNPPTGLARSYHEPGVLVDANASQLAGGALEDILVAAEAMDQDRLVPSITGKRTQVYAQNKV